ncbi:DNA cytosine methyltransferase [Caulobacter sp. NIBR2454]|uniref:DNA cytosine methyltransferase n=1 Tax=Caulobacter sp. NIBR2454 TaxID=3015996 RepID=UPI0022B64862|nr:DNA cytosine methyltransferase [Caulobacter sp. NIBR2454]
MNRAAPFSFYEFFAGGGMARLGLGEAWTCLFANDFDPLKARTYRENFPDAQEHLREGDVWAIAPADLPGRADLAWASSPCQDFSLAGGRAGLQGGKSSAFFGFWRLMESLDVDGRAPGVLVVENVSGLLTSNRGQDFEALCRVLTERGYRVGALEVDATTFTPQSRPRIFVIAARTPAEHLVGPSPFQTEAVRNAYDRLPKALKEAWAWWAAPAPPARNADLASILEPDGAVVWRKEADTAALLALMAPLHLARVQAAQAEGERAVGAVFRRMRGGVQRAEVRFDGVAGCLRTPRGGSSRQTVLVIDKGQVRSRLLTAREAARLMGLPEEYRLPKSQSGGLHVMGDGVAVPVVRWLAEHLLEPLAAGPIAAAAE